jgi:hypothetical protein
MEQVNNKPNLSNSSYVRLDKSHVELVNKLVDDVITDQLKKITYDQDNLFNSVLDEFNDQEQEIIEPLPIVSVQEIIEPIQVVPLQEIIEPVRVISVQEIIVEPLKKTRRHLYTSAITMSLFIGYSILFGKI